MLHNGWQLIPVKLYDMLANGPRNHYPSGIPGNRTLLIDRFTLSPEGPPIIVPHLRSLQEVFDYFKPAVSITMEDEHGPRTEQLQLRGIEDLHIDRLSRQSAVLQQLLLRQRSALQAGDVNNTAAISELEALITRNRQHILAAIAPLEQAYRSLALFFLNAGQEQLSNLSLLNATPAQLNDRDMASFRNAVALELKNNFDRLDLYHHYSLLVIPGYIPPPVLEQWARIAHQHKVMLITSFENFNRPDDVVDIFTATSHTGAEPHLANVVMTCNWLVARKKYPRLEPEECYVPPAAAYAGRIYQANMSHIVAGKNRGVLLGVHAVRFPLGKAMVAHMEKLGLVPMIAEYGKVRACSGKTLFNGDSQGLQIYTVVRVFDYITKVVIDYLNRRTFETFNSRTKKEIIEQIAYFLDSVTGTDKLIGHFNIQRFEQHEWQKDIVYLDLELKPFFPSKNYLLRLNGHKKEERHEWQAVYEEGLTTD